MKGKKEEKKLKIVFFGTPEFAVESLDRLIKDGQDIAAVVTMPDKIAGRGHKLIQSDVKKYALEKGLRVLQPEKLKSPEFIETLKEINADLFIVIAFRMLPEAVWTMPPLGTFNLHASLLPKYRGAAPINWAVINGEKETGVTTFFLKHEIDTGDIIDYEKIEIQDEENVGSVHDRLMKLGADLVSESVKRIADGSVTSTPQPEGDFTPAPKIFKETCRINWNQPAIQIFNLIRGLSPYPGAWTLLLRKNSDGIPSDCKVFSAKLSEKSSEGLPGNISLEGDRMFVDTLDKKLEILSLQPAGKKAMETSAFLRGYSPIKFE